VTRGDVHDVGRPGLASPAAVIVTRPTAIGYLTNVTVVLVTTRGADVPTEVELGAAHGLVEAPSPTATTC
jgi:mRNA-degrading endonuclease toxin of MazEF toxin-antitoxin module